MSTSPRVPRQPTPAEIFGLNPGGAPEDLLHARQHPICPFPHPHTMCSYPDGFHRTGICSVIADGKPIVNCPVRLRDSWKVCTDAAQLLLPRGLPRYSRSNVPILPRRQGGAVLDVLLGAYDGPGPARVLAGLLLVVDDDPRLRITDRLIEALRQREERIAHRWPGRPTPVTNRPKLAVVLDSACLRRLPRLPAAIPAVADLCWLVYCLRPDPATGRLILRRWLTRYTVGFSS